MHLFFARSPAFIQERPSLPLFSLSSSFSGGLNAATFREHGSDSPTLVTLPDSTSNNISTRPFFFFFSQAFVFAFQGGDGKTFQICILYQKDVTVWFDCKENRAESNAQHCTVAFLHTAVRQSEVCSGDKDRACENGGQQQMCVQESSVNAHRQT